MLGGYELKKIGAGKRDSHFPVLPAIPSLRRNVPSFQK